MTEAFSEARAAAAETEAAMKHLKAEGEETARVLSQSFEAAGAAISDALEDAARAGEFSFAAMTEAILSDLAVLALERLVLGPLDDWSARLGKQLGGLDKGVSGQRAEGGPVMAGQRYLVGERGPEVFTPMGAGVIQPPGAPVVHITINAGGDAADSVRRSERQIAAAIARAASRGSTLL